MVVTMNKPTVAIDVDDVLVPHGEVLIEYLNRRFETSVIMNGFYSLDELSDSFNKSRGDIQNELHNFLESEEFAAIEPIEESMKGVERLRPHYELKIVTARPGIVHRMTGQWLEQYFPGIFKDVQFSNMDYQWGTVTKVSKQNACQVIGADCLIDDSLKHIQEVSECGMRGILFGNYHWNQADELPPNTVRAGDWEEVVRILT